MQTPKVKIQAIYPLQHLQQALLFHHLSAREADQGLIQTRCRLQGPLDRGAFTAAWAATFLRHEALRASVHWEKVSKPVWVVHPQLVPEIDYLDWSDQADTLQRAALSRHLVDDRRSGLALDKVPTSRLTVIKLGPEEHFLNWTSHHLLLDGWSAGVVLRDFMTAYAGEIDKSKDPLDGLPPNHKPYLAHLRAQNEGELEGYWRQRLGRLQQPSLLPEAEGEQRSISVRLDDEIKVGLIRFCQDRQLTQNSVLQGLWALLLGRYFGAESVCFGITVNGRPPEISGVDGMAGMFARILPKIVELEEDAEFFHRIQRQGALDTVHQYVSLDQIAEWSTVGGDRLPFNTMLAVQNYPWTELAGGGLTVTEFAGDITSRYPVTCVVVPRGEWEVAIRIPDGHPEHLARWLLDGYVTLIRAIAMDPAGNAAQVARSLPEPLTVLAVAGGGSHPERPSYVAPGNSTQLKLVGIWEQLLPVATVGIDDNFFHCGGTSMAALRMFARLERSTGENLAPSSLLLNPTIRQLAGLVDRGDSGANWNNLVPQRVSGSLPPVFCFHGGMGHVLMYQPLTRYLHPDRPVYGLQPNGIDGVSELDGSIEEMGRHYLAEIDRLGVSDPLILVSYCYSGTICLEIGRQLIAAGRPAPIFIGADIDPPGLFTRPGAPPIRRAGSLRWYWGHLRLRRWRDLWEQLSLNFIPVLLHGEEMRLRVRARRLKNGLVEAFERYREQDYGQAICLIRSEGLKSWDSHDYVVDTWRRISGNRLTVNDVPCQHHEIFEEPIVKDTARHIERYIEDHWPAPALEDSQRVGG